MLSCCLDNVLPTIASFVPFVFFVALWLTYVFTLHFILCTFNFILIVCFSSAKGLTMPLMVVLPTYNEKENLPLMVEALLALGIAELQILVVDDNSPDDTGAIADELKSRYTGRVHVLHRA